VNSSISDALDQYIVRALEFDPDKRWQSVSDMLAELKTVRRAQMAHTPVRSLVSPQRTEGDWSTQAVEMLEEGSYRTAESIARAEYETSKDEHAFMFMIKAAYRDGRYFDCIRDLEGRPDLMSLQSLAGAELRRLALMAYLEVRNVDVARRLVTECLEDTPGAPDLLLKHASILALDAKYEEAAEQLMKLNRQMPGKPAILRRLVAVYEQMRDTGKAVAFLRAYSKLVPDDPWSQGKLETFTALGMA
jgi:serine/threonine-protein kinase